MMDANKLMLEIPDIDGDKLKLARQSLGLSQEELAKAVCLSRAHIDQLENDGRKVFFSLKHRYQVALKVADYLGLSDNDIRLTLEKRPSSSESQQHDRLFANPVAQPANPESKPSIFSTEPAQMSDSVVLESQQKNHRSKKWLMASVGTLLGGTLALAIFMFSGLTDNQTMPTTAAVTDKDVGPTDSPVFDLCNMTLASGAISLSVDAPVKKGDSVTIISKVDQAICVLDNSSKTTSLTLLPDGKQVIIGQPPFMIQTMNLNELEIYFQGRKLRYPIDLKGPIKLTEGALKEAANQ